MGQELGLQTVDSLFETARSEVLLSNIDLPEIRSSQELQSNPTVPERTDFNSLFRQHAQVVIKPLSYCIGSSRSYPVFDSFSKEEINQWGDPLINCHIFELLAHTKETWLRGEITSVKTKSRDHKTNRIGFSLNTYNGVEQKEHWLKITSDGENIFITKNNGYHRTFKPNQIGFDKTQEKIQQILTRDSLKRPFGKHLQPEQSVRRTFLQTIPQTSTFPRLPPF